MLVWIVEIQGWRETSSTGLLSWSGIHANSIKCRSVRDVSGFDAAKYGLEVDLGNCECVVLEAGRAPRGQLNQKVGTDSENSKGAVHSLLGESQHAGVERNAGSDVVDLQDDVIKCRHDVNP